MAVSQQDIIIRIISESRDAERNIDRTNRKLKGFNGIINQAKATAAGLFIFQGVDAAIKQIGDLSQKGVQLALDFETTKISFETFLGSASKANKLLKELSDFSVSTPFTPEEVNDTAKQLLSFGISADKVVSTLKSLGDVAAGTGTNFKDLAFVYGQIRTQQTAYTQDLLQFASRGIPIFEVLAKNLNTSAAGVKKLASEGKIGFREIEQAFQSLTNEGGKFAGLTQRLATSGRGLESTFKGAFDSLAKSLGNRVLPLYKSVTESAISFVNALRGIVEVKASEELENQRFALNVLVEELTSANTAENRRKEIIQDIQREYPDFLKNLDTEKVTNEELRTRLKEVNDQYRARIILQRLNEDLEAKRIDLAEKQEKVDEFSIKQAEALTKLRERVNEALTAQNKETLSVAASSQELLKAAKDISETNNDNTRSTRDVRKELRRYNLFLTSGIQVSKLVTESRNELTKADEKRISVLGRLVEANKGLTEFLTNEQLQSVSGRGIANVEAEIQRRADIQAKLEKEAAEKLAKEEAERQRKARAAAIAKARKEAEADKQRQLKAIRNIEDLKTQLISNKFDQREAGLRIKAQRQIEALVGTETQIKEQTKLINEILERELNKLADERTGALTKRVNDALEANLKFLGSIGNNTAFDDLQDKIEALDTKKIKDLQNGLASFINVEQLNLADQIRDASDPSAIEGLIEDTENKIRDERLKTLRLIQALAIEDRDLYRSLTNEILGLEKDKANAAADRAKKVQKSNEDEAESEKQLRKLQEDLALETLATVTQISIDALQAQIDRKDQEISIAQERVNEFLRIASEGNAEQLQLEEERLAKLKQEREKAVQVQRRLAAVEIAINNAVAISASIRSISEAFTQGPVIGILTVASIAAAIASTIATLSNAFGNVPAFRHGTDSFDPNGAPRAANGEYYATLSRGEMVLSPEQTKELRQAGITTRAQLLEMVANRNINPVIDRKYIAASTGVNMKESKQLNKIYKALKANNAKLDALEMNVSLDKKGFVASIRKEMAKEDRIKKWMKR